MSRQGAGQGQGPERRECEERGCVGLPRTLRTVLALAKRTRVGRDSEGERAHKEAARSG